MVCMTSHLFQLALVAARCSGVDVPNTSPRIFSGEGAVVQSDTIMATTRQNTSIQPQKKSQLQS